MEEAARNNMAARLSTATDKYLRNRGRPHTRSFDGPGGTGSNPS
jgi:hypothetical protein